MAHFAVISFEFLAAEPAQNYCTVKTAVEFTPFMVAVMVLVPDAIPLATPRESMVATLLFEEVQTDVVVMPAVDPSLNVPVAANCCDAPVLIEALAGLTTTDTRVALVTVRDAVPTWPAKTAEIVALPA